MCDYQDVRSALLEKREVAFLDVREEDPHAQAHPLFAANFPLSRVELDAYSKLPRRDVQIVTLDEGDVDLLESDAMLAARRLVALGFSRVAVFAGGVRAWQAAGGELFRDVNVPSKSFGELVEAKRHTPSLSAPEVKALIDQQADVVIVDVRRYDEYNTMSIPTATSCPGAELVLRIAELAPRPETQVIVNCAGRTRSIIGTQSLINAGIPNKVSALRNGTIGWTLAGQALDKGETRKFKEVSEQTIKNAAARARSVAERAGVKRAAWPDAQAWRSQSERTTYFFDARTPEEFAAGHIAGFRSTPGGQLVQETEMVAPVRGACIVLVDTDGVRANMTASWLAQMAWDVYVLTELPAGVFSETGPWVPECAMLPLAPAITVAELAAASVGDAAHDVAAKKFLVIDLSKHAQYVQGHIPGAQYVLRSQFKQALSRVPNASAYVLVCPDGMLSGYAHAEIAAVLQAPVSVLTGGTQAWKAAGLALEKGATALLSEPIDRYKRPYEGTDAPREAMQAYLDWEFGLVAQLGVDGTHHFEVV
jgi:rhodanese-related sulfurtransferase